jgi:hypothetical protein
MITYGFNYHTPSLLLSVGRSREKDSGFIPDQIIKLYAIQPQRVVYN